MLMATIFLQNDTLEVFIPYLYVIGILISDTFCGIYRVFQIVVRGGGCGGIRNFIGVVSKKSTYEIKTKMEQKQ